MCEGQPQVNPSVPEDTNTEAPAPRVRQGWAEAAQEMAARGDDALIDAMEPSSFDEDEWRWADA
jgi:hypothetical protein